MKGFLLFSLLLWGVTSTKAQKISETNLKNLQLIDDSLDYYGAKILDEILPANRLRADSMFTRILVRGLRTPYSFYFSFDSMRTAPVVYPADSSFRIITWHYTIDDVNYHQRGAIQINTPDGSLKLFPLYDVSAFSKAPEDSIRTPQTWIGAVYYNIIQKEWMGNKYYTLLGYDANNERTTRKWMEILQFNQKGEPRFGGNFVAGQAKNGQPIRKQRFLMEYKKNTPTKLNYDPEEDLIVMDHLISESNDSANKNTLVPGGDYEGFKWNNGQWVNIPRLFVDDLGDNNEPRPALILSDDGVANEESLRLQSEKNMKSKGKQAKTAPVKKPGG